MLVIDKHSRPLLKGHQLAGIALALSLTVLSSGAVPSAQAKGLFGDETKDSKTEGSLQAQLYQIQQQLTQLQAQMTQLQLQMNKRTTVIEQKQNSLHETLTQQGAVLRSLNREEQQLEHQVQAVARQVEPLAVKPAAPRVQVQQPTLEESADYEVAKVNTKATPAYKSHIQDLDATDAAATGARKKPVAIAAKPATVTPPAVTDKKSKKAEEKAEKAERAEREKAERAEEKADAKTGGRMLPGYFGDRLSKAKKETSSTQPQAQAAAPQAEPARQNLNSGKPRVKASIIIKAPPEAVWDAVHEQRKTDPELAYSKVLKQGVNEAVLEQKFTVIPMIGSAVCTMNTQEVPNRRIDYQMIKSDRFKAMEGSWVLIPSADGKTTTLELSTHVDLGLPVPKSMMNGVTHKKLERRLSAVRELAEKSRMAQKPGGGTH
jgi:hypothetical protein